MAAPKIGKVLIGRKTIKLAEDVDAQTVLKQKCKKKSQRRINRAIFRKSRLKISRSCKDIFDKRN